MSGHEAGSEWISISDLMAGVVAVMVVLFAVSSLENALRAQEVRLAEVARAEEEAERARRDAEERRRGIDATFEAIQMDVQEHDLAAFADVDVAGRRIRLREATFSLGSACVMPAAQVALQAWAPRLKQLLQDYPSSELFVEGHTDSRPVTGAGSNSARHCARFDDNYTLSAARAREARSVLVEGWSDALRLRTALAGFGDSRPLVVEDRESSLNRRVEIAVRERTRADDEGGPGAARGSSSPDVAP